MMKKLDFNEKGVIVLNYDQKLDEMSDDDRIAIEGMIPLTTRCVPNQNYLTVRSVHVQHQLLSHPPRHNYEMKLTNSRSNWMRWGQSKDRL